MPYKEKRQQEHSIYVLIIYYINIFTRVLTRDENNPSKYTPRIGAANEPNICIII